MEMIRQSAARSTHSALSVQWQPQRTGSAALHRAEDGADTHCNRLCRCITTGELANVPLLRNSGGHAALSTSQLGRLIRSGLRWLQADASRNHTSSV